MHGVDVAKIIERYESRGGKRDNFLLPATILRDAEGRFAMPRVPPGEWEVTLHGNRLEYHETKQGKWRVESPGPVVRNIVIGRLSLTGIVRDSRTGAPVGPGTARSQGQHRHLLHR